MLSVVELKLQKTPAWLKVLFDWKKGEYSMPSLCWINHSLPIACWPFQGDCSSTVRGAITGCCCNSGTLNFFLKFFHNVTNIYVSGEPNGYCVLSANSLIFSQRTKMVFKYHAAFPLLPVWTVLSYCRGNTGFWIQVSLVHSVGSYCQMQSFVLWISLDFSTSLWKMFYFTKKALSCNLLIIIWKYQM